MEEELVSLDTPPEVIGMFGSQANREAEPVNRGLEASSADGEGHARLGSTVVFEGCGISLRTVADGLADLAAGSLVDNNELDKCAETEITNGFA